MKHGKDHHYNIIVIIIISRFDLFCFSNHEQTHLLFTLSLNNTLSLNLISKPLEYNIDGFYSKEQNKPPIKTAFPYKAAFRDRKSVV